MTFTTSIPTPGQGIPTGVWALGSVSMLIGADLILAFASGLGALVVGVALWGLHMGFAQGLLATLVAEAAPAELRGTAFGTFLAGAAFAALTLAGGDVSSRSPNLNKRSKGRK